MSDLSHSTKITVGLAITFSSMLVSVGYFYARQENLISRVEMLESDRNKTAQMSEDIAVIKERLTSVDARLQQVATRLDLRVSSSIKY